MGQTARVRFQPFPKSDACLYWESIKLLFLSFFGLRADKILVKRPSGKRKAAGF